MSKCTEQNTLYEDIEFCQGKKSLPGIRPYIFGISKRDIATWPTIGAAESLAEVAAYTGDFTLVADKVWHKLELVPEDGQFTCESQGTYGSKTFKNAVTVSMPGTEEEATGYIAQANNDDMVYLVPQRNGKYRVMGSEAFNTELSLKQDSGKAATDSNVTTMEISATDEYPAPFYAGKIVTSYGTYDGETGELTPPSGGSGG